LNHEGTKDTKTMLAFSEPFFWQLAISLVLFVLYVAVFMAGVFYLSGWLWYVGGWLVWKWSEWREDRQKR
jgi:hypothetical protein